MSTYVIVKRIIERGNYDKEKILTDIDVLLLGGRLAPEEWNELEALVNGAKEGVTT